MSIRVSKSNRKLARPNRSDSGRMTRSHTSIRDSYILPVEIDDNLKAPSNLSFQERCDCIEDVTSLGQLRAFSAAHKIREQIVQHDFHKQCIEQERLQKWRNSQIRPRFDFMAPPNKKEKDLGILENVALQRNQQKKEARERGVKISPNQYPRTRVLPRENRAFTSETSRVYYWG